MGMQNMQVQQPMNQSMGKGGGMSNGQTQTQQPQGVEDLYSMYSDRGPDAEGLAYWKSQFGDSIDQNEINTFQSSVRDVWNKEGKPADYGPMAQPQTQSTGKGAGTTNAATSGQPRMGMPNNYPNTIRQWDNASIQPQQSRNRGGKGKG